MILLISPDTCDTILMKKIPPIKKSEFVEGKEKKTHIICHQVFTSIKIILLHSIVMASTEIKRARKEVRMCLLTSVLEHVRQHTVRLFIH